MELTYNEQVEVKNCAQKLLNGKFVCGYNNADAEIYTFLHIDKYREAVKNALDNVGYDLLDSATQHKTTYIRKQDSMDSKCNKFNMIETILICTLARKHLENKRVDIDDKVIYYKWNDLVEDTGASKSKSDKKKLIDAIWRLKVMGICDINSIKSDLNLPDQHGRVVVSIYPSILCLINTDTLAVVEERLSACVNTTVGQNMEIEDEEVVDDEC